MSFSAGLAYKIMLTAIDNIDLEDTTIVYGTDKVFHTILIKICRASASGSSFTHITMSNRNYEDIKTLLINNGYSISNVTNMNGIVSFLISW